MAAAAAVALLSSSASAQVYTESVITGPSAAPALATYTVTQDTGEDVPLASKVFNYPYLPYRADSGDGPRGIQTGYNICNATTEGDDSLCQTGFLNSLDDFCVWGSQITDGELEVVGDIEGEMVAYCTKPGYGTRVLPPGAITGVQFTQTPGYVQVVGYIDQTVLGLRADDYGGEEDNKGADMRGNPLGSLMYTSAFGPGPSSAYKQVRDWSYFIGGNTFCFKTCDPAGAESARLCEHVYDRIGCAYNAPADYASINGTFQSCKGDNQLPAGVYVGDNGVTSTYYQPPESLGPITSIPYTAAIPASSQCSSYTSSDLFSVLATVSHSSSVLPSSATSSAAAASASASGSAGVSAASRKAANLAPSASASNTSGASKTAASALVALAGVAALAFAL